MSYTTTTTNCTTLIIYHPPETFIESIRGQKFEEQLKKDLLTQLMDSVFKQALKLEKTFHRMNDSTISITWKVPNPYTSTSQSNLANEQNRYEATDRSLRNLISSKNFTNFNKHSKYRGSALEQLSNRKSQYEIRRHRTMNMMIFLRPNVT